MKKSIKDFKRFLMKVIQARDIKGDNSIFKQYSFSCMNVQLRTLEDFHFATNLIDLLENHNFKFYPNTEKQLNKLIKEKQNAKERKRNA